MNASSRLGLDVVGQDRCGAERDEQLMGEIQTRCSRLSIAERKALLTSRALGAEWLPSSRNASLMFRSLSANISPISNSFTDLHVAEHRKSQAPERESSITFKSLGSERPPPSSRNASLTFKSLSAKRLPSPRIKSSLISKSLSAERLPSTREGSITDFQVDGRRMTPKLQEGIPDVQVAERQNLPNSRAHTEFQDAECRKSPELQRGEASLFFSSLGADRPPKLKEGIPDVQAAERRKTPKLQGAHWCSGR